MRSSKNIVDLRAHVRRPVSFEGRCYGTLGSAPCAITDLSKGGLKFVTDIPHKVGAELTTAWRVDANAHFIYVNGIVRYTASDGTAGLEFVDLRLEVRHAIAELLASGS